MHGVGSQSIGLASPFVSGSLGQRLPEQILSKPAAGPLEAVLSWGFSRQTIVVIGMGYLFTCQ
jgi:hypothetical protein